MTKAIATSVIGLGVAAAFQVYFAGLIGVYVVEKVADKVTPGGRRWGRPRRSPSSLPSRRRANVSTECRPLDIPDETRTRTRR